MKKFLTTVVSLILALLAPIVYLNLRLALDRAHQNRTMADIRTLAVVLEARASDRERFPAPPTESFETMRPVSFAELERALVPVYSSSVPHVDGWGNSLEVRVGGYDEETRSQHYAVRSVGSDGHADSQSYTRGTISRFSEDIVFSDGNWIRYPEGL